MPKKKPTEDTSPSFEEAMTQLQTIAQDLEEGQLGLEEMLVRYEQGTALLRHCHQVLSAAEQKIEQLTGFDQQGNPVCEPFDASATLDQREQTAGRRQSVSKVKTGLFGDDPTDET